MVADDVKAYNFSGLPLVPGNNFSVLIFYRHSRIRKELPMSQSEENSQPDVKIFSLSTCSHCKATKKFMGECTIKYEFVDVDMLKGDERKAIIEDVKKFNPRCSFPTIIIGEKVIVGFKEKEIKEALGM
jgi:glutaredoxin